MRSLLKDKPWPKRLSLITEWSRADEGGIEAIRAWLDAHDEARLLVIDILQLFRARAGRSSQLRYEADYEAVKALQQIALDYNVAILIVHHTRKAAGEDPFDEVSGTHGLAGGVDTVLVLKRASWGVILFGRGRDIENDIDVGMRFNRMLCRWVVMGPTADVRRTDQRKKILRALDSQTLTPKEIADATEMKGGNVRRLLLSMVRDGEVIRKSSGRYQKESINARYENA
jgi:hypothetical protein